MEFTREQTRAIRERHADILVSAGAGAGKTRVLVNRIADLITDPDLPVSADEILVMTFTNAAAQEMKERIGKELSDRLDKDPDNAYLRKQIRLIRQADISTVHSFCHRLLRTHFQEIGLDPSFRIGEEGELMLLGRQAMEEMLEEAYLRGDQAFLDLVETLVPGKDDRTLENSIDTLYHFTRGFPDGRAWFEKQLDRLRIMNNPADFEESLPVTRLIEGTKRTLERLGTTITSLRARCHHHFRETGQAVPTRFEAFIREMDQAVNSCASQSDYQGFRDALYDLEFQKLPAGTKAEKQYIYLEEIKETCKEVRDTLKSIRETDFRYSIEEICRDQAGVLTSLSELSRLVVRYEDLYFQYKKEQNVYDFDDLEHMTLELLITGSDEEGNPLPSETALALAGKYKEIFVDEYQDTSMIQETILAVLHQPGVNHLFTVGDIKQSIYRFRQARPDLFLNRLSLYREQREDGTSPGLTIELRDNFRSAPRVLSLCNKVFRALMDEEFGGISYDDTNALRVGEGSPMEALSEESEFMLLMEDDEVEQLPFEYDALYAETAMIAGRIREFHDQGYSYGDMVILLRSAGDKAETMAEYLKIMGIPAECEKRKGYFGSREVAVVLNYLAVIDNVRQDIPMASVLLSSIGGFTEEELALLKCQPSLPPGDHLCLFDLLVLYGDKGKDGELKEKIHRFLSLLARFRRQKKEMPLHKLLWNIYSETGFYYDVLLMPEGDKRRENLNMLLKKAEEYEKTVFKGLFYFIRYIDQMKSYEIELPEAGSRSAPRDRVRIMTIHKSKGLEFPVVFVSALSGQFNFNDTNRPLLFHPELGMGMDATDLDRRLRHVTLMKNTIRDQIKKDMLEEEMRILYVAMTRAKKRLVLTGVARESAIEKHEDNGLFYQDKLRARSYMDWILPIFFGEKGRDDEEVQSFLKVKHLHQLDFPEEAQDQDSRTFSLEELLSDVDLPEDYSPVSKAFSYVYPYASSISFKRKYSVSELKKLSMTAPSEEGRTEPLYAAGKGKMKKNVPKPAFLSKESEPGPAMRGTIVHKVMELLPFGRIGTVEDLQDALKEIEKEYKKAELVSMEEVCLGTEAFLFSEEGNQIRQMDREGRFFREVPFTISLPVSFVEAGEPDQTVTPDIISDKIPDAGPEIPLDITSETVSDIPSDITSEALSEGMSETIIVQGIIDAYGEDEEGLWLIDYKTDRVRAGEEDLLLDRYKKQMLYYKTALEMLIKKPVYKTSIYSFALKKFIPVPM